MMHELLTLTPRAGRSEATRVDRRDRLFHVLLTSAPALTIAGWLAHRAADRPMTAAESVTMLSATRSWWSLTRGIVMDPGMTVYYAVARLWALVVGGSIERLRLLSLLSFAVAIVGVAMVTVSRRRTVLGMLAAVGLSLSPMAREAVVDGRATALGIAGAVWLVVAFDLVLGSAAWSKRRVRTLLVASVVVGFIHPSVLFVGVAGVGVLWRRARRRGDTALLREVQGTAAVLAGGALLAVAQAMATLGSSQVGFSGIQTMLSQLPGGRALAGIALLLTGAVLLAGLAYDEERIVRWFGGAALAWFGVCLVALPVRDVFEPRYFAPAAALVVVAVVSAKLEGWTVPLIATILAIGVLGSAQRLDTQYGFGSRWCDATSDLVAHTGPGDRVISARSEYLVPVTACLGSGAASFFDAVTVLPVAPGRSVDDPKALWQGPPAGEADLTNIASGERLSLVWSPSTDAEAAQAVAQLEVRGVVCDRQDHGDLSVAFCAAP